MTILFNCEHCHKEVKAPDEAGGKRGKCPYCGNSNYIPSPVSDEDLIPLAPIDEEEERQQQHEVEELFKQEREVRAEMGGHPEPPLEQRDGLAIEDLYHFVVNFCLDMFNGKLERATKEATDLRKYGPMGMEALQDFLKGKAQEPALAMIPARVLQGFLLELKNRLQTP